MGDPRLMAVNLANPEKKIAQQVDHRDSWWLGRESKLRNVITAKNLNRTMAKKINPKEACRCLTSHQKFNDTFAYVDQSYCL